MENCPICNHQVVRKYLQTHTLTHRGERLTQFGVNCKLCGNFIPSKFEKNPNEYATLVALENAGNDIWSGEKCPNCHSMSEHRLKEYYVKQTDVREVHLQSDKPKSD